MLEKFVVGLAVTIIGAIVFYVFRHRQLYVVIPRLFSVSLLTSNGRLVEVRAYNKSRVTEEDVIVSLDPTIKYELVASTDATPSLNNSTIQIPRIPPGDDFSVLLLVEGGEFTKDNISTVSSKTSKGRVIQKIEEIPPNFGNVLLSIAAIILLASAPIVAIEYYNDTQATNTMKGLSFLNKDGWAGIETYARSEFKDNYAKGEFPIYQSEITRTGNYINIPFKLINKSASEMQVMGQPEAPYSNKDPRPWETTVIENESVEPMSNKIMNIKLFWPKGVKGSVTVSFNIMVKNDAFISIVKNVEVSI